MMIGLIFQIGTVGLSMKKEHYTSNNTKVHVIM